MEKTIGVIDPGVLTHHPISTPAIPWVSEAKFTPSLSLAEAIEMAALFNALRHPVRLRVLGLLAQYGDGICVYEIADALEMSQPTISHHLAKLQECGLVTARSAHQYTYHQINHEAFARVPAMVAKLTGQEV